MGDQQKEKPVVCSFLTFHCGPVGCTGSRTGEHKWVEDVEYVKGKEWERKWTEFNDSDRVSLAVKTHSSQPGVRCCCCRLPARMLSRSSTPPVTHNTQTHQQSLTERVPMFMSEISMRLRSIIYPIFHPILGGHGPIFPPIDPFCSDKHKCVVVVQKSSWGNGTELHQMHTNTNSRALNYQAGTDIALFFCNVH